MSLLAVVPVLVHYKVIIVLYLLDPQDFGFLDPESGYAKICGFTDPDPRGKIS